MSGLVVCRGWDPVGHSPTAWARIDQEVVTHPVAVIDGAMHPLHLVDGEPLIGTLDDYQPTQVLLGWVNGYHHLRGLIEQIERGDGPITFLDSRTAVPVFDDTGEFLRNDGELIEWPAADEFAFIAEHGFVPMFTRECRNNAKGRCSTEGGWRQVVTFLDPNDSTHPRFHEF